MSRPPVADRLELLALPAFPLVRPGDCLAELIARSARENRVGLADDDVLVIAQKIVSKAEGRLRPLSDVEPSDEARRLAGATGKDARLVELILQESAAVLRLREHLLITENRLGIVMANAGIDRSNVEDGCALLLPVDPDRSAEDIRAGLKTRSGADLGVIVSDSIGRAWRNGVVGHAIGVAGIAALLDLRGASDLHGRRLEVTEIGVADEIAAAASLLMGQAAEGKPVVLARGLCGLRGDGSARDLLRRRDRDLFR
ncbi:MAG TPA: coenzyme F420-0:L-glutamate ligase [Woeseiaceae bacterium]|nr:coenzyme F420-0:L-glutamate ligase [Woeseiaceae bacterium]